MTKGLQCLNAPFGPRCFLTEKPAGLALIPAVLMHLLALRAFWHDGAMPWGVGALSLNAPFGARCFLMAINRFKSGRKSMS